MSDSSNSAFNSPIYSLAKQKQEEAPNWKLPPSLKAQSNPYQTLSTHQGNIHAHAPFSALDTVLDHSQEENAPERFELKTVIGQGSSGKVWAAFDHKLNRKVAMKYFQGSTYDRALAIRDETRLIGDLEHPGIPAIYDTGAVNNDPYLVMKLIEGTSLTQIIKRLREGDPDTLKKYPFSQRIEVIIQILRVLAHAHRKGILHRDIKPDNIMIGETGEVSLIDWGIAIKSDEIESQVGQVYGTPLYMSPEQCFQLTLTPASDLFSVGAVAYEFLSLECAGPTGESAFQIMMDLPSHKPKQVDYIVHPAQGAPPSEFTVPIMKALSREPKDRQASAEEFLTSLQGAVNGYFLSACPRTQIKGTLLKLTRWLDLNPFVNVPIFYLTLLACMGGLIGFGIWIARYV